MLGTGDGRVYSGEAGPLALRRHRQSESSARVGKGGVCVRPATSEVPVPVAPGWCWAPLAMADGKSWRAVGPIKTKNWYAEGEGQGPFCLRSLGSKDPRAAHNAQGGC